MKLIKKLVSPFEKMPKANKLIISFSFMSFLLIMWSLYGVLSDTHIFPTIGHVMSGMHELWLDGLMTHIMSSLILCFKSVFLSIFVSLLLSYLSTLPIIKPIAVFISKFRYLPLTGISFYITMLINDGRSIQIWILVVFMSTFLTTSLLSMLNDIKEEEFDHARALGCSRWEMLLEVVILGRFDYVIEIIRQNLAIVWMMLVTVESILAASGGLGFLIKNSDKFMNHGRILALQFVILFIGLFLDFALNKIRKASFRYSKF